jgi:zinc protease
MLKQRLFAFFMLAIFAMTSMLSAKDLDIKDMNAQLPVDPNITIGKLDNGLTYYIKENTKPEDRALFQILVYAGSIQEDEDQKGLAHFLEHMCFNGTESFPKNELVDFLESTGMRFGADINASTGFERTLYFVEVPTDKPEIMDNGMKVIEEWAHRVTLDPEEIEKERGVIMEEWRVYKGADERVSYEHYPYIFYKSKYADRLPIGDTAIILHAERDAFLRFYEEWYRPELMAVIAVGDFDKNVVEKMIKERFSQIKNPKNARKHEIYPVPDHKGTLVSVASDKELQMSMIQMYFKHDNVKEGTYSAYRDKLKDQLMAQMLNARLAELTRMADAPFYYAGGGNGRFIGNKGAMSLVGVLNNEKIVDGSEALMKEAFRALQHGFTETELERAKTEVLTGIRKAHKEKDKTENLQYAMEYGRNYMNNEGIPGIDYELMLQEKFVPEITLTEVNDLVKKLIKKDNLVIALSVKEVEGVPVPKKDEVLALFEKVSNSKLEPYIDKVSDKPFFDKDLMPGNIVEEKTIDDIGVTVLKLTNGARVLLKPTELKMTRSSCVLTALVEHPWRAIIFIFLPTMPQVSLTKLVFLNSVPPSLKKC